MNKNFTTTLMTALLFALTANVQAQAQDRYMLRFDDQFDTGQVSTNQAHVSLMEEGGLIIQTTGRYPQIEIAAPSGAWDIRGNTHISFRVSNTGSTPIRLSCHLGDHKWNQGMLILEPGQQDMMKTWIKGYSLPKDHPLAQNFDAMRGLPGGWLWHWIDFDPGHLTKIRLSLVEPEGEAAFKIHDIRAGGNLDTFTNETLQKEYFPFVDRFGQYMLKDWPGKIHSEKELKKHREKEKNQLRALPGPSDWDQYGGWKTGPKLGATGHFRVNKWKGKWWLVDPQGHLFWSHGPDGVRRTSGRTRIAGRAHYFKYLPEDDDPLARFYQGRDGKYASYNFTGANLLRKYGADWKAESSRMIHQRLRSWGMNTIANWSESDIYLQHQTPYVVSIHYGWHPLGGGNTKFPDVFHPEFRDKLMESLENASETWDDPWCIGYFVDNELHGWNHLGYTAMHSGSEEHAKQQLVQDLRGDYQDIEQLNESWETNYNSWKELLNSTEVPSSKACQADLKDFREKLVDTYYRICKETVDEMAPNKLYLGSRMAFHYYPGETNRYWVVDIAARHCDVISFNRYKFNAEDLLLHGDLDRPVIIGEFHFGALDRGMLHTGLRSVQDQKQRGKAYYRYIKGALTNPYLVGAHWFTYGDQALTGRGDGENYQIGLVDVCDTPYQETIDKCREIGYQIYRIRSGE